MTRYIAILRGINVGGKRKILMSELKGMFEKLGYLRVSTYIQSGNVIFDTREVEDCHALADGIENEILKRFGHDVPVIVRTVGELEQAISRNPFLKDQPDIKSLFLTFLQDVPSPQKREEVEKYSFPPDDFRITGKEVFGFCPGKYSDSKLTNAFFENKLGIRATTRNWKTVTKLFELAAKR